MFFAVIQMSGHVRMFLKKKCPTGISQPYAMPTRKAYVSILPSEFLKTPQLQKIVDWIKGQIISKRFFLAEDSPKKRTKTHHILVKTNLFIRFLEEFNTWQFAFKMNWPLEVPIKSNTWKELRCQLAKTLGYRNLKS